MGLTSPEGPSKGKEHVSSFQVLAGSLHVSEVRVLANVAGKLTPLSPLSMIVRVAVSVRPLTNMFTAEHTSALGRTYRQEPSCGGRGKRLAKYSRKRASPSGVSGKPAVSGFRGVRAGGYVAELVEFPLNVDDVERGLPVETLEEGEPSQEPGRARREGPTRHPLDPSDCRGVIRPRDLGGPHDVRS